MPGFANDASVPPQSIMWTDNLDFSGNVIPSGQFTTNGQLMIGASSAPFIRVATLSAGAGITITNGPGTISVALTGGGAATEHLTGDSGGQLNPDGSNNFNLLGQKAGTIAVFDTIGSGSTISFEDRTWTTQFVVDPSSTVGLRGTFTTIQAAITAASSGQDIFIRPGTYTEDLTLKAGVNLCAFQCDSGITANLNGSVFSNVIIKGKCSFSSAGTVTISGVQLQTNSDFFLSITGSAASIVNLVGCYLNVLNNNGISYSSSSSSSQINISYCCGDIKTTGITPIIATSAGSVYFAFCDWENTGGSSTASTSTTALYFESCLIKFPISITSTSISASYTQFNSGAGNATSITTATSGISVFENCNFKSGTSSALAIGASTTILIYSSIVNSNNGTAAISGAGTLNYGGIVFEGTCSVITVTTQIPSAFSNDLIVIKSPGAYPYTTIPQDALILVDTSSARTIIPLASPVTGQVHRIKDNVGSAAANNITITPSGKNIDGAASHVIATNYGSVDIVYQGTMWVVL